jgi:hypothetical protein
MRPIFAIVLAAAGLSGCMSDAEVQAHLAAIDNGKCKSYGARFGTPAYTQCRAQLDAARTQAVAAFASAPQPTYTPMTITGPPLPPVFAPPAAPPPIMPVAPMVTY